MEKGRMAFRHCLHGHCVWFLWLCRYWIFFVKAACIPDNTLDVLLLLEYIYSAKFKPLL